MKFSKILITHIFLIMLVLSFYPVITSAAVSLPWSTTYNCPEWNSTSTTPGQPIGCDNMETPGVSSTRAGHYEQITSEANYPGGGGGRGQRHWIGGGVTSFGCGDQDNSSGVIIRFPSTQNEIWVRWYQRFQTGFTWSGYDGFKLIYVQPSMGYFQTARNSWPEGSQFDIYTNSGDNTHWGTTNGYGYEDVWGDPSIGAWHCLEVHFKRETSGSNGVMQFWVDGVLKANHSTVRYGGGVSWLELPSNAKTFPCGAADKYVDFDDVSITNSTPSKRDAQNNPMIGPINYSAPPSVSPSAPVANFTGSTINGTAPLSVSFSDSSTNSPTIWAWDFNNDGIIDSTTKNPTYIYKTSGTYSVKLTASNSMGTNTIIKSNYIAVSSGSQSTTSIKENFDDGSFSSRGWYDNTSPALSTADHISGSTSSLQVRFPQGAIKPISGNAMRKKIDETDSIYLSFYIKHSSNWVGSNRSYQPHLFYVLTNKSGDWNNLSFTHLTAYIEQNGGYPLIGIQDSENIDESKIGQNLTTLTEYRSVAGCNGDSDGYGDGSCYQVAVGEHSNWKQWKSSTKYFSDSVGPFYKGDWHFIEVYIKLNSIFGGKAVKDGVLKYWYDGNLVMDYNNVVLRTGEHPDMKFNQFVIAPFIGDGSPVDQIFWIDDLIIGTQRPGSATGSISSPTGLRIAQ